jgi:transposase
LHNQKIALKSHDTDFRTENQTMMGQSQQIEPKLFYHGLSLERRISQNHILRKVKQLIDFNFIRSQVEPLYGINGHKSLDPAVILKLMFVSIYYNVKSERALMEQLPLRLDWLWFCGYDLDDQTPDHSALSKARRRWGQEAFSEFFAIVLGRCMEAGLVDGKTVHLDSSMIDGNASKDSLTPQLRLLGQKLYNDLDKQVLPDTPVVEETVSNDPVEQGPLESRVSTTDPDARLSKKYGKSILGYKDHRVLDDQCGIITATITTPANVHDAHVFVEAIERHQSNTDTQVTEAIADKGYGTTENYKYLKEHDANACIPHQRYGVAEPGKFSNDKFTYDKQQDCFICPAGQKLTRFARKDERAGNSYRADRAVCEQCEFFSRCVSSSTKGRQVQRADDAHYVEWADSCLSKTRRKYLLGRRKYKAEGSFADAANNHGFKRARWRGIIKMQIQNLLIAAIQNLRKLMRLGNHRPAAKTANLSVSTNMESMPGSKTPFEGIFRFLGERIFTFIKSVVGKLQFQPTYTFFTVFQAIGQQPRKPPERDFFVLISPERAKVFELFYKAAIDNLKFRCNLWFLFSE